MTRCSPVRSAAARCRRAAALAAVLLLAAATPALHAQTVSGARPGSEERFGPYEDSFAVWNRMRNNGWARHDESALRAHYSFKYTFCGPRVDRRGQVATPEVAADGPTLCPAPGNWWSQVEVFGAYTGEFDFYFGTRASSPVINRLSQPGLFLRLPMRAFGVESDPQDGFELSLQHRSNGQVGDVADPLVAERANLAYASQDREFFDTLSRNSNFVSLAYERGTPGCGPAAVRVALKFFVGEQEGDVVWGPEAGRGRRISNHDRLTLRGACRVTDRHTLEAEWRVGSLGLAGDSLVLGWQWDVGEIPFYVRVHLGPMNTLSNYTQRQDSIGFGIRLARFR
jgi:hypothetical protein